MLIQYCRTPNLCPVEALLKYYEDTPGIKMIVDIPQTLSECAIKRKKAGNIYYYTANFQWFYKNMESIINNVDMLIINDLTFCGKGGELEKFVSFLSYYDKIKEETTNKKTIICIVNQIINYKDRLGVFKKQPYYHNKLKRYYHDSKILKEEII